MKTKLDIDILQLMASKICHDLISPIGAVNNGIEFMEEMGPDAFEDATQLIGFSATQASAKLQAYRMAYASGGADSHIKPEDVKAAIDMMVAGDGKVTQDWEPDAQFAVPDDHYERPAAYSKILICALLLALDCLPKGGNLNVTCEGLDTVVTAKGENAAFREQIERALALDLDNSVLDPKHMHAILTGLMVQRYEYTMTTESEENLVRISFTAPHPGEL